MALTSPSLSPAIVVREFDLTGVAPNVETSLTGFVGRFKWGPVLDPRRVPNEGELAEKYGTPDPDMAVDYFSAQKFLQYSDGLIVCRQHDGTALNASPSGKSNNTTDNEADYDASTFVAADGFAFAKYPGEIGNTLKISVFGFDSAHIVSATSVTKDGSFLKHNTLDSAVAALDSAIAADFNAWEYQSYFDGPPGTSTWAQETAAGTVLADEVHMVVVDEEGLLSGNKGSVLETFSYTSVFKGARTVDGGANYIKEVLNLGSNYVWFGAFDSSAFVGTDWGATPSIGVTLVGGKGVTADSDEAYSLSFDGGADGGELDAGDYQSAFDEFEDVETVDVQILVAPGMTASDAQVTVVNDLVGIAERIRKDCVVVTSPNRNAVVTSQDKVNDTLATTNKFTASNYLIVDNNYFKVYDKYNDQYIYIPAASSTAGLMAATDYNYGPWWSPAGERRGQYVGVTAPVYSPTKAERDELYKKGVNPIVQFPAQGIILFGDKTKQSRPSAFDRINVRRLFLAIEKSIAQASRNFLFEFNDEFTRAEFVAIVEPLLREIQAKRGIQDFFVQCDERNNTPEVIDRNEFVATMFIKPARSINFITLNFVAVRTGVDFEEIVGRVQF
jgi:hypothetical protein